MRSVNILYSNVCSLVKISKHVHSQNTQVPSSSVAEPVKSGMFKSNHHIQF